MTVRPGPIDILRRIGWLQRLRVSPPVNQLRYRLYRDVLLRYPKRKTCNICGWRGRHFLTFVHWRVLCPQCGSQVRHRLIAAALSSPPADVTTVDLYGARVLHISPEYCLGLIFRPRAAEYVCGDYATDDADIHVDMTAMSNIQDEAFDILIAADVLEHIPDDRAAMREAFRVLRSGGVAILTVPQLDAAEATFEDPAITAPDERTAVYGQFDHVRNYGTDFTARLEAAGFKVTVVEASDFSEELQSRHVLQPARPLSADWGWNRRRVHFAWK